MPCFHPLDAWHKPGLQPSFSPQRGYNKIQLNCSQCIGCRLERSRQWASRCLHEASLHNENSFLTLTYETEPSGGSLVKPHLQKFLKRLRWHLGKKKIRYFACGEYGDELQRPHYHLLLFGHDFKDKQLWRTDDGVHTYTSDELESVWGKGFATTGDLTWQSAAYVARYCVKKRTGKQAAEHYERMNLETGEIYQLQPEFITMSLKPAIGREWFNSYKNDCFPKDFVTHMGKKYRVPKYYDQLLDKEDPDLLAEIKEKRKRRAWEHFDDNSPKRLKTKEQCALARSKRLRRTYEH